MKIEELLQLANNKLNTLQDRKNVAYMSGDMDSFYKLEEEILETEKVINKLNS